jgi:hypothetical protein
MPSQHWALTECMVILLILLILFYFSTNDTDSFHDSTIDGTPSVQIPTQNFRKKLTNSMWLVNVELYIVQNKNQALEIL